MFKRDRDRLKEVRSRVNTSPLGAAALAGTKIKIDRYFTAEELGFDGIYRNSKVFLRSIESTSFSIRFFLRAHWGRRTELINRSTTSSWEMLQNAQSHTVTSIYLHMVYIKMHIKMYIRNPRVQIFKDSEIIPAFRGWFTP